MIQSVTQTSLLVAVVLFGVGCVPTSRTYDVTVRNQTSEPVTLWLTKNGPPAERGWEPPEALAQRRMRDDVEISGVVLVPGGVASTGTRKGKFYSDTGAALRVYSGKKKFDEILAVGRDSPNRYDYDLDPGVNDLIITSTPAGPRVAPRSTTGPAKK